MRICDKCMSERVTWGARPHAQVFGPNGTRWRQDVCHQCGKERNCVERDDLYPKHDLSFDSTAAAIAALGAASMGGG